jgi:lipopolysaccharide biosynthesis glycosyltransferase
MKRMIFQVCLGGHRNSALYKRCIQSVAEYAEKYDIEHKVLTKPVLRIKPDIFITNRSQDSYMKHGGYLPIFEKENAFDYLDDYDQIAIIDADIYIREDAPNIFDSMNANKAFGCVFEREMPITDQYKNKIYNYSAMQYDGLHNKGINFKPNTYGYEFANMGMIVLNCKKFKSHINGQSARQFLTRLEFKDFIDGKGAWKWSTDQTLLNYFLKKYNVPVEHMHWKWNGLYTANTKIEECYFIHFFLKDKLPGGGENIDELLRQI